jgi:hypothetical protein
MADDQMNQDLIRSEPLMNAVEQDSPVAQDRQPEMPAGQPEVPPSNPPESDTESEAESEIQEEDQHTGPHLQIQPTHQVVWNYAQHFGIQTFLWLQILWRFISGVASTTQTISKGVLRSLQVQHYVFFEHSNYPYRLQDYTLTGPGVAQVEWYYNADTKLFLSSALYNTTSEYTSHHLEWLTGQIRYNNLVLYDISDFLQQVKWAGSTKPSAARVMAAWSLYSGVVLSGMDGITLQTINEDGTESTLPYRG